MKEWVTRIILLAALGALGYWGWGLCFPNPEKQIRKQLNALAKEASFAPHKGLVSQAWSATVLGDFFTPDVQVAITVPGMEHTIDGRAELMQAALSTRHIFTGLVIDFPDIKVAVAPDKQTAVVNLTARGKATDRSELYLEELRLRLVKVKRDWLIREIVTVRTLS